MIAASSDAGPQAEAVRARLLTLNLSQDPEMLERVLTDALIALQIRGVAWDVLPEEEQQKTIQTAIAQDVARQFRVPAAVEARRAQASAANSGACPQCGLADKIQKVSSAYQQGRIDVDLDGRASTTNVTFGQEGLGGGFGGGPVKLKGHTETALAASLRPPVSPKASPGLAPGCGSIIGFVLLCFAVLPFLGFSFVMFSAAAGASWVHAANGSAITSLYGPLGLAFGIPSVAILLGGFLLTRRGWRKGRRKLAHAWRAYIFADYLWNELYYCARDNGVYWPYQSVIEYPKDPARNTLQGFDRRLIPIAKYRSTLMQAANALVEMRDPRYWTGTASARND